MTNMLARVSTLRHQSDRQRELWDAGDTPTRMALSLEGHEGITVKIQDETKTRMVRYYFDLDGVNRVTFAKEVDGVEHKRVHQHQAKWWRMPLDLWWIYVANAYAKTWVGISILEARKIVEERMNRAGPHDV